jgi:CubicO group peptidase (beta-lactamase class C family)
MKLINAALCLSFSTGIAAAQAPPARIDFGAFDAYVARTAREWQVPALAIAIVKDDSLVFAKGFGVLETGKPTAADAHTRFAIGSTTKAMTTAALALLVDEGKIRWDDRVIDYMPDFQLYDAYATRELTIRDLLTHRSGLPGTDLLWAFGDLTRDEMFQRLRYIKPESSFRSQWDYQNVVYSMAGAIVAKVSGMPWDKFVRTRLFAPLGMNETEPLVADIIGKANVATPHVLVQGAVRTVPIRNTDVIASVGSVWSSVSDMSKWMRFMLDSGRVGTKRLIAPATFNEIVAPQILAPVEEYPILRLTRPHVFNYSLGWFVEDYQGEIVWMHTGSIDGMSAIIGLMPARRLGVYILENLDHAEIRHSLMYQAFDLYTQNPPRDWSAELRKLLDGMRARPAGSAQALNAAGSPPSLPLDRYAGTYTDSAYGNVSVTFVDGVLSARYGKHDLGTLEPVRYETFRARGPAPDASVTPIIFQPDGAGAVTSLRVFGVTFMKSKAR